MITLTQEENTRKEKEEEKSAKKKRVRPTRIRIRLHGESGAIAVTLFTEVRSAGEHARARAPVCG